MVVSDDNKGREGKCPKCRSIIIVPAFSEIEPIFDDDEVKCKNPIMQAICDELLSKYKDIVTRLTSQKFEIEGNQKDFVNIEIQAGEYGERIQNINFYEMIALFDEKYIEVKSEIGDIQYLEDDFLIPLLSYVGKEKPHFALKGSGSEIENFILELTCRLPLTNNEIETKASIIIDLGLTADILEKMATGLDIK
jgi:hypothetical protein